MRRFHLADATSCERALPLSVIGVRHSLTVRYLQARGVIRCAGPDRYFIDEPTEHAFRQRRFRFTVIALIVGALAMLAVAYVVASRVP